MLSRDQKEAAFDASAITAKPAGKALFNRHATPYAKPGRGLPQRNERYSPDARPITRERNAALARRQEREARQRERTRKLDALEARILAMRKEFEAEDAEAATLADEELALERVIVEDRDTMAGSRRADIVQTVEGNGRKAAARRN